MPTNDSLAQKLQMVLSSKNAVAAAIVSKGGTLPRLFSEYGNAIRAIPSGGQQDTYDAEVEYISIDSSKNSGINTGVSCIDADIDWEICFKTSAFPSSYWEFGAAITDSSYSNPKWNMVCGPVNGGAWAIGFSTNTHIVIQTAPFINQFGTYKMYGDKVYVNGTEVGTLTRHYDAGFDLPMCIGCNSNKNGTNRLSMDVKYAKYWKNSVLVRDFKAVRANGIGYLYDDVSKKLFGSLNSLVTFSYGPDKE